ncbi:hypothetical protein AXK11_00780 [Cephaloticoccus primus]|uniref:Copper-binding protein n=1 Tax=Cephaloticoccus primus TaxID=1548207 RepID=A0A139SH81_9BACT|nr:copper-binding protein [Cephaloticoccus primus]KXU33906.1 hypothetical protein AXK11_00780 [Cephaloticoccus primus]
MSRFTRLLFVFALGAVVPLGLDVARTYAAEAQPAEGPLVRGMVTRLLEDRKLVMVKHEEIPGVMRAMTMAFSVPEEAWPKLKPGAYLIGNLQGGRGDWRLVNVRLTDRHYNPLPEE